jgi:hypothetical protein
MDGRPGMIGRISRWLARLRTGSRLKIDVVGARPLSSGLAVYVIDVDGRRIVLAAGSHSTCVLAAYRAPHGAIPEGQPAVAV